ncbi:hypothetical protein [Limnofasciculus baicalensis]|uniref:Uncharacterized protein n=1 Tax=Limnofasciculus baicalensis BBK-W-15 TaxID=2699891 RepID=A0AAE3KQM9_9CYAN|nr:hypothetical protein [Limnofasciculus baicalensis]MCP2732016.1 hypothetical protein [Limnofasciculus baicalensis BBK-W-15]
MTENKPKDKINPTPPEQLTGDKKLTYEEKTSRIQALTKLIKALTPYLWVAIIIIVIIPLIGKFILSGSLTPKPINSNQKTEAVVVIDQTIPDWNEIDRALATSIKDAHANAETFASAQLNEWIDELMTRVDSSFLDWYFNYFNQKKMEFSIPFVWLSSAVSHWIDTNNPPANQAIAEKMTGDFQTEFTKLVLRPQIAQLELERITRDTINQYVSDLSDSISQIQSTYKIPQGEWERYLSDIAVTINDTEGNISNLSLKALVGGSTYLFAKAMIPTVTKIGSKVAVSFAEKATAKIAAKTGGTVAAKFGAEFLDPIVGIGIIIWDLWDYHHTVEIDRPILRDVILDYLQEVKYSLLGNYKNSIMAAIYQLEDGILKSVNSANFSN